MKVIWETFERAAGVMGPAWAALVLTGAGLVLLAGVIGLWLICWR